MGDEVHLPEAAARVPSPRIFALPCLTRLQLRDNQQMLYLSDPAGGLQ
ncbi:hypothetical protein NNX39_14925 [Arthrobacter sp. zg-Y826]|nr:hypothetical protein [Arthrobacter jinronghuae]MCQ1957786.1 hypothetical protein [Arthrobacter jinronghuae]